MLKNMHRINYTYEGEEYTLGQLYKKVRKKRGRAKVLASVIVGLGLDDKAMKYKPALYLYGIGIAQKNGWLSCLPI